MRPPNDTRRRLVLSALGVPFVGGMQACTATLPAVDPGDTTPKARNLLAASAAAHGLAALDQVRDISVSYAGHWHGLVARLQPALIDAGFRGGSEERLLLGDRLLAQAHTGPLGHKHVVRRWAGQTRGEVRVWFNDMEALDAERRAAAALVVDGYSLFLLGPMLLGQSWGRDRNLSLSLGAPQTLTLDGRRLLCDVLLVGMIPGLGFSAADRLALYIDRDERLMRRVRFSLDGLESTQGAIAEVDTFDHLTRNGVRWPTRFHEHLRRPATLPVHEWRLTGLDVNRGLVAGDIDAAEFSDAARRPAAPLG